MRRDGEETERDETDELPFEPESDAGPIYIPDAVPRGCLDLLPEPLARLVRWLVLRNLLQEGESVAPAQQEAAILLTGCWANAEPVHPQVCSPVFQTAIRRRRVAVPNRRESIAAAGTRLTADIAQLDQEIARTERALRQLRASQDGQQENRQARIAALEAKLEALRRHREKLREDVARARRGPGQPPEGEPNNWSEIRGAGRTTLDAHICFSWKESPYQQGGQEHACCVLAAIYVVPRAEIQIDSRKEIYIHRDAGVERKTRAQRGRLGQAQRQEWVEATPWSVEAHEREHVNHFREQLQAHLSTLVYLGAGENRAQLRAQQRQIELQLTARIEAFIAFATLQDLLAYPHGESETSAVTVQRELLVGANGEQRARERRETAELAWDTETDAKIAADAVDRCTLEPAPPTHCLRRETHSRSAS